MIIVSFWPILAAALAAVVIGFVWYGPLFGSHWKKLASVSTDPRKMVLSTLVAFLGAMLVAYVMSYFGIAWGVGDWLGSIELGFWSWIGFVVPTLLVGVNWEGQPFKLYAINAGYWLVTFIVMAFALVYISPLVQPKAVDLYKQGGIDTPSQFVDQSSE